MQSTDAQVRKLMEEMSKHGKVGLASMRAGMDRKTGRKYVAEGQVPSEHPNERSWRTRADPFEADFGVVAAMLVDAPELEAKTLFEWLWGEHPERYHAGHLRTLQRRVREWRAKHGPPKRVFFAQAHRPGEAMQTDFTWGTELGITIEGQPFPHLLCHVVLPYSNWDWATVCHSESMVALRRGLQSALTRLGRVTTHHQTDNSTAATHNLPTGERGFNEDYLALMRHFSLTPRRTGVGEKEQNGDVEAANGALKRRLKQHLLMRGHADFESAEAYERWLFEVVSKANRLRGKRVAEELAVMRPLNVRCLPEYDELELRVSSWSTIRVKHNSYSVPSRLVGEEVIVRLYEDRLEVFYKGTQQLTTERLRGRLGHRIDYRHVIWSLVKKPGAFQRYRYREDLFPGLLFRKAYDVLCEAMGTGYKADLEYLRLLHLAASTMEAEVEAALSLLLEAAEVPTKDRVMALIEAQEIETPNLIPLIADLSGYDNLLQGVAS